MKIILQIVVCCWLFIPGPFVSTVLGSENDTKMEKAIFAGGCFWCVEHLFDEVEGVTSTISGYTGGHKVNPKYKEVSSGRTGHTEAVEVIFDSEQVSYEELLRIFWVNIDPTTSHRQFCDYGEQYRPGIFYFNEKQKKLAVKSRVEVEKTKSFAAPILTEITKAGRFYPAEDRHQNYHHKNPYQYKFYRYNCGRDKRLKELWGNDKD
ncbi:MAG: peptide-methionine (S)-S-oxide reductase MsrA [Magnetococcales bacterium]|nr:peptide-methionine (S)-S-oxide reductase MsrA [Magnetococcales bacterium]